MELGFCIWAIIHAHHTRLFAQMLRPYEGDEIGILYLGNYARTQIMIFRPNASPLRGYIADEMNLDDIEDKSNNSPISINSTCRPLSQ
jgi:hypothetical protein